MTALLYLLQVNIYLVLFYGLYLLLLRKETFFKLNRLYLVGSALLSLSIPLLKAGWIKDLFVTEKIYQVTQSIGYTINKISFTMPAVTDNGTNHLSRLAPTGPDALNASQVFWIVYGLITAIFLLNFLRKLYLVNRAFKENPKYQAFSFFNKVMVDEKLKGRETILDHEMVHVRQWHSADVIFFELFSAFNWFNPIAFTYKKAIRNIHEFIADETAAATLDDKAEYALLLVSNAFGTQTQKLTNSFYNDSLLKRRLIMLNKDKSKKVAVLKYGLSVPLFAIMVICSSATIEKSVAVQAVVNSIENGIPIVVDVLSDGSIPVAVENIKPEIVGSKKLSVTEVLPTATSYADSAAIANIRRHFLRSIKYAPSDQEVRRTGTTYFSFELDATGAMQNPVVVRSMSDGSKFELLRAAKNAPSFGGGVAGKYLLIVKYELSTSFPEGPSNPEEPFDFSKYLDYQRIDDAIIRGYVRLTPEETTEGKLRKYFANTIKYPAEAFKSNQTSNSNIVFEIDQSGKIINSNSIASNGKPFENELMRVLNAAKPFEDVLAGKYMLPVLFAIQDKESNNGQLPYNPNNSGDYKRLNPILIMGHAKASRPDSIITYGGWQMSVSPAKTIFSYVTSDEQGTIVNYIKVDYLKNPIILHNGKVATYKTTDKGFKLDIPLYPKQPKIDIYTGDDAVKNYNESVRSKGLIVVTTE